MLDSVLDVSRAINFYTTDDMTQDRWQQLCATHEADIFMIRSQLMGCKDQEN